MRAPGESGCHVGDAAIDRAVGRPDDGRDANVLQPSSELALRLIESLRMMSPSRLDERWTAPCRGARCRRRAREATRSVLRLYDPWGAVLGACVALGILWRQLYGPQLFEKQI
jgi:hypothetical protein